MTCGSPAAGNATAASQVCATALAMAKNKPANIRDFFIRTSSMIFKEKLSNNCKKNVKPQAERIRPIPNRVEKFQTRIARIEFLRFVSKPCLIFLHFARKTFNPWAGLKTDSRSGARDAGRHGPCRTGHRVVGIGGRKHTLSRRWGEHPMARRHCRPYSSAMSTLLIIVVLLVLFGGGGGYYYARRR